MGKINGMYKIKEIYYTLQGEGFHTGRPAIFCRFAGCNLWSGREVDRAKAICKFCDTDFRSTDGVNGGKYTAIQLTQKIADLWPESNLPPFVVCTGGEPAMQIDANLVETFHSQSFEIALETNGTISLPHGIDWICVSPKADTNIVVTQGHELKLVYPQLENKPEDYDYLNFEHRYLQPLDDAKLKENINACIEYCLAHPTWKLSIQTHKILGID